MNGKLLCVCILSASLPALAGSLFLAGKNSARRSTSPRAISQIRAQRRTPNAAARSASVRHDRGRIDTRSAAATSPARQTPLSLPFAFEPNVGQANPRVAFIGRGRGLTVSLTRREMAIQIARASRPGISHAPRTISVRLAGQGDFAWHGREKLRGETNYLLGNNPSRWRTHVPHFAQASAANAAPGVGILVYGNDDGIEYDLRVAPRANLSALRFKVSGADTMRLAPNGDILLQAAGAALRMKKPFVYQQSGPANISRKPIEAAYILDPNSSLGFRVGPHDPRAALIIDPSISVAYATFLGGSGADTAASVALDAAGKVYVGGTTTSVATFPGARHTLGPGGGTSEFFIAKIDPTITGANSLVYLTFLGGSQSQSGGIIAAAGSGSVAITGTTTSADYPVTDSTLPTNALATGKGNDVVVTELDPTGGTLVFSTIFGGSGSESQSGTGGIALDPSGDVYIASDTGPTPLDPSSPDLPVTPGAYSTAWDGQESDGFLAIFTPPALSGGAATLKYCSYLGTNALAEVSVGGIAVDAATPSSAYIAGGAQNATTAFPFTNAFQASYGGGDADAFLMKIAPLSQGPTDLVYATLLGGSGVDQAQAIALDSSPNPTAYLTGVTDSLDFPTQGQVAGFSASLNSDAAANAFFAAVGQSATGQTSLLYSTYFGGSGADAGQSVAVVAPNQVYVGGTTSSWDMPWHDNVQPFNGQAVAFVAKFDPTSAGTASLIYATPLGGTSSNSANGGAAGNAIAADSSGHVYLAGGTTSPDFPTAVTSSGNSINGSQAACSSCWSSPPVSDAFLAELQESASPQPAVTFSLPRLNFSGTPLQLLGLTNTGEATLNITGITVAGPHGSDFSIVGDASCVPRSLGIGGTCSLGVQFTPSVAGYETAVVSLTDNAPGSPQEFELVGSGPGLAALPIAVNFPPQQENTASDAQQITLTVVNPADQTLTIDAAPLLGGANPGEFQLAPGGVSCNVASPMNPGSACGLSVVFVPQAAGSFQSEIDIPYHLKGDEAQTLVVPLTGSASAALSASISVPPSVNFGSQLAQTSGAPQPITIANSAAGASAGPLVFAGVSVQGANSSDFDVANNTCTQGNVAPGGACTVQIAFRPLPAATCGTEATRSATLTLRDNAAGSPQSVALSGTAEDFCFSAPTGQAASAPITPGLPATYNLAVTSAAGFTGTVALSCSVAPVEASDNPACALSTSTVSVSPTTSGQFMVNVTTTAPTTSVVPHGPGSTPPSIIGTIAIFAGAAGVTGLAGVLLVPGLVFEKRRRATASANPRRYKTSKVRLMGAIQAGALLLAFAAGLSACGGGSSDPPASDLGTPLGTYTITVTATFTSGSTTVTRTVALPLTID
ncbi:MAG TPA: choice-of-anchor D domain-containing protein [Candidatus Acidoferrales bacterium]|nr:choice-of-anchor D domain-containing protein [Candidatus Acidoferrales bacterium]